MIPDGNGGFVTGGYYRYDPEVHFTFLTVPKAGHFVPYGNFDTTLQFLKDYINDGKLVCHKEDQDSCRTQPIMCKWMNNCNGNGVC